MTVSAAGEPPPIRDRPIRFDAERARLTLEYRRRHEDPDARDTTIAPRMVVLHYTAGSSLEGTWRYFDRTRIDGERRQLARAGAVNVSAHFLVDRDGTIYRLLPETTFARHCIGLNHVAIGIENVGDGDRHALTEAQVAADAALVRMLAARFPLTHLIGHSEAQAMKRRRHPYWRERDPRYQNDKPDPGEAFLARVRERVGDLGLAGPGDEAR